MSDSRNSKRVRLRQRARLNALIAMQSVVGVLYIRLRAVYLGKLDKIDSDSLEMLREYERIRQRLDRDVGRLTHSLSQRG